jgi:hypothetical protein
VAVHERPQPARQLNDVTSLGSTIVAVGEQGEVLLGTDGNAWRRVLWGGAVPLREVAAGVAGFAAVGEGVVLASPDGSVWSRHEAGGSGNPTSVASTGPAYVEGTASATILHSTNGTDWTPADLSTLEWQVTGVHRIVASSSTFVAAARTYNTTPVGTYGQLIPAFFEAEAAPTGQPLRPFESLQLTEVLRKVTSTAVDDASAEVRTTTPAAALLTYARLIDNRTNDPLLIPAQLPLARIPHLSSAAIRDLAAWTRSADSPPRDGQHPPAHWEHLVAPMDEQPPVGQVGILVEKGLDRSGVARADPV